MAALYDRYGGIACGLACRTLGASAEAEDVVQEAFLDLWRQAKRLDPARGLRGYLLTIVHNKAVDRVRRRVRRPELTLEAVAAVKGDTSSAGDFASVITDKETVRAALRELPDEQRQAVEMAYFAGLTITEIAGKVRVPIGTVKSRLRLALTKMRRALTEPT